MEDNSQLKTTHPTGESLPNRSNLIDEPLTCDTYAGKIHVEWDQQSPVTPMGQLVFFSEFLKSCDLFSQWVSDCPLNYKYDNKQKKMNILGTLLLAAISGQKRYAHVTAIRQDSVNPPLFGMTKIYSEDSARMAFTEADETLCKQWQQKHLEYCYGPLLEQQWILDIDATVKPLYGKQEGAEVGYNPQKPGRPAHIIHTYVMAETRLVLDCEVLPGKQSASTYSLPRLMEIIRGLPKERRPHLIRGDCAFGNEKFLYELESEDVDYLFKIKQTTNVKKLIDVCNSDDKNWVDAGQGWQGIRSELLLQGWSKKRKVIVLRRRLSETKKKKRGRKEKSITSAQMLMPFLKDVTDSSDYEYAVLVTSLPYEILSIAQLYRDRATSENNFDELKNQWGWGGFVTHDIKRSQIMARIVAQVFNWWTLFVRWIDPDKHREAITSRPLLLYGVGRQIQHAGQTKIIITSMHGKIAEVQEKIGIISRFLNVFKTVSEKIDLKQKWMMVLSLIFSKFLKGGVLGEEMNTPEVTKRLKTGWNLPWALSYGG